MNTANTSIFSENTVYSPQQAGSVGSIPIFTFPGVENMPVEEDTFRRGTEELKGVEVNQFVPSQENVLELSKKYYQEHKESLLKKYKGKYIAILNNKVIGSGRNFSKLAQRVYKKYGYQTIYIPFVDAKEKVVRIPSKKIEKNSRLTLLTENSRTNSPLF